MQLIPQPIYETISDQFESFIDNNRKWLDVAKYDAVVNLKDVSSLACCSMLAPPFLVAYIGKYNADEGPVYVFLNKKFNKLYSYYDIE